MKKRYFGVLLVVCLVLNMFNFVSVSARTVTQSVNVGLNKDVDLYYNGGNNALVEYTGYEASKMVDGDTNTFTYDKGFNGLAGSSTGHLAIIDLGQAYDITSIVVRPENTKNAAEALGITTANGYTNISTPNQGGCIAVASVNRPVASQFSGSTFTTSGDTQGVKLTNTQGSSNFLGTRNYNLTDNTQYRYVSLWVGWSYGMAIQEVEIYTNVTTEVCDDLYVSPDGDDNNDGSAENPFKTIGRAKEEMRNRNTNMVEDITVHIAGGRYELPNTLDFDAEDSGTNGYNIIYSGDPNNMPTFSAGTQLDLSWTQGENGIWSANVSDERITSIRELYVNDMPATRARSSKLVYGTANYVADGSTYESDGFYVNKADLGVFANQGDIQFRWTVGWKSWLMYINQIVQDPGNPDQVIVKMNNPEWDQTSILDSRNGWPGQPSFCYGFRVENALELLDEQGEFYFDKTTRTLSYMPRDGETLQSASVIAPRLDKIMSVSGEADLTVANQFDTVKNVQFKNIRFAHSGFSALDAGTMHAYQCEMIHMTNVPKQITPGAVEVAYADSIAIEDCVFFGIGSAALELTEKVTNSSFTKNIFTDIGFGAFIVGNTYHDQLPNSAWSGQWQDYRGVVSYRKPWTTSNQRTKVFSQSINTVFENPESLAVHGIWRNEPNASADGIRSWVKMDLGKEYDIHSVMLSFAGYSNNGTAITTSEEERRDFEILVSNDESFSTYQVLATQSGAVNDTLTVPYGTVLANSKEYVSSLEGKYRYVMVKKTTPEAFAMSLMRVYSFDERPYSIHGLNVNNTFENNYISRVGVTNNASAAITAFDTDGLKINHNEITDVPYSGISIGYAWDNQHSKTAGNNEIKYNKITDVEKIASDGGAIYAFGNQSAYLSKVENGETVYYYDTENKKPLEVTDNYIENQGNIICGLYCDSGSAYMNFEDNVLQNASALFYAAGMSGNDPNTRSTNLTFNNLYGDDLYHSNGNTTTNVEGNFVQFSSGQLPNSAMEIKLNSGIEASAEYIKNRVPENMSTYILGPDAYAAYTATYAKWVTNHYEYVIEDVTYAPDRIKFTTNVANSMLDLGNFGSLPWQIDAKYESELGYWLGRIQEEPNRVDDVYLNYSRNGLAVEKSHMYEFGGLDKTYRAAVDSIEHLSYADMVSFCQTKSSSLSTSDYPAAAITAFNSALSTLSAAANSTKYEEYTAVTAMEVAYDTLENAKISADLKYAYVEDGTTSIDYDNKTVEITVPSNVNTADVRPVFTAVANSTVVGDYSSTDFTNGANVTLRNTTTSNTTNWNVTVVNAVMEMSDSLTVSTDLADWNNTNPNSALINTGDGVKMQPWYAPTMYKKAFGNRVNFSAMANDADNVDGINFIFGAKTCGDLEPEGYYKKNTYYMLTLKDQTLTLYSVDSGVATEVANNQNAGFNYGEYNDFEIKTAPNTAGDKLSITLNGESIFENAVNTSAIGTSGYFGVYSKLEDVTVVPCDYQMTEVAGGKYAFSNWHYQNYAPSNMTDGDSSTALLACDYSEFLETSNEMYAYVDLGAEYNLSDIEVDFIDGSQYYTGLGNRYVYVYATNTRPDGSANLAKTQLAYAGATSLDGTYIYNVDSTNTYRYILFEKQFMSGISVSEVRAYAKDATPQNYTYDIAKNKATVGATATGTYSLYMPANATDGKLSTFYKSSTGADSTRGERLFVDLGEAYSIDALTLSLNSLPASGVINIYLTNDSKLSSKTLAYTLSDTATRDYVHRLQYIDLAQELANTAYRYVVIEKTTQSGLDINEIGVVANIGVDQTIDNSNTAVQMISRSKSVIAFDTLSGYSPVNKTPIEINNGDYAYSGYVSNKSNTLCTSDEFVYIDLGAAYEVPYVSIMTDAGYNSMTRDFQIVGSNVEPALATEASNFTVLYDGDNDALATTEKGTRLYQTNPELAGETFRYIGVRKPNATNSSDTRIVLKEMDVYTYINSGE